MLNILADESLFPKLNNNLYENIYRHSSLLNSNISRMDFLNQLFLVNNGIKHSKILKHLIVKQSKKKSYEWTIHPSDFTYNHQRSKKIVSHQNDINLPFSTGKFSKHFDYGLK